MPISAQQWRLAVGRANASRSLRPRVTGQPKMKWTSLDVLLFILTTLLGAILSGDGGRGTKERKCVSRGSGGGGTLGELAPSLLTVPWMKELLVLAGDIESNPGPYTDYTRACGLYQSDLELVMEELRGVEEKWRLIGKELKILGVPSGVKVNDINYPATTDCLREVFKRWLMFRGTTWGHIIVALRKAGEPQLADNLKAKYIPDLLEESDLDLLTQELTQLTQHKWESIGRELHPYSADAIHRQYSDDGDHLREMLRLHLQLYTSTTWRNIVDALRSSRVAEFQLADQLEAKYCPITELDLLVQELSAAQQKWEAIGRELGVKQNTLGDIRTKCSDPGYSLRMMLRVKLKRHCITWKYIITILRTPHVGESNLADQLETKYCLTAQQILEKALEKGYVDCHIWKVLVTGAAGSGKTTLKHRLFGKDPPSLRRSTALAEAAIRAISREIVGTDLTGWFKVTSDELMELLGGALKGGVPMEEGKLTPGTPEAPDFKQPAEFSIPDHSTPSTVAYNTASTSSMPTSNTTEAAVNVPTKISTGDSKQCRRDNVAPSRSPLPPSVASSNVSTTSESAPVTDSSAKKYLVQLVEKSEGSKRFLELQWIHFIDSGGQPQFHEVLPAFIRNTTATIFVLKLSERLDEHPVIKYYDENGQVCGKPFRHALTNEQMLQCCVRTILSQPSREGKYSKTLVVGTHRDKESFFSESRTAKNRKLLKMLVPSLKDQLVHYHLGTEVIFPINAMKPEEQDHQVCAEIRKQIADKKNAPPPYKIPIGWFLLEQDIIKVSKEGVISKSECLDIAAALNINGETLIAALQYFDDLNIFLYYPSVLPEVVFSNPQILLDKVTELVHFSYSLHTCSPPGAVEGVRSFFSKLVPFHSSHSSESPPALEGKWLKFRDKGMVTLEMFQDERFSAHYIPDLFTPTDLIKLLKHLLIVAPLSDTEYFMPSLLQMTSPNELVQKPPAPSSSVVPLLVYFPAGCAQNGVFCALVVYLLSECHWEFAKGISECVSRSCVHLQLPDKPISIALVDSFSFFKVTVEAPKPMYSKICPKIREAIFSGVEAAARALKYNNSKPKPALLCGKCSSESPPHAATPAIDDGYLVCTQSKSYETLTEQHTVWFNVKLSAATEDDQGGTEISKVKRMDLEHPSVSAIEDPSHHQPIQQHTQPVQYSHEPRSPSVHCLSPQQQELPPRGHEMISHQPEPNQYSYPQLQHPSSQDQADLPTLMECIRFRGRERRINIPQEIGVKYHDFGLFLLEDENRQRIKAIAQEYANRAEEINKEILEQWITGRGKHPITWKTLTEVLHDLELSTLAKEIEAIKS